MSLHVRVAVGPVVLIDCELLRIDTPDDDPPAQLNGGQGQVVEPWVEGSLGFRPS